MFPSFCEVCRQMQLAVHKLMEIKEGEGILDFNCMGGGSESRCELVWPGGKKVLFSKADGLRFDSSSSPPLQFRLRGYARRLIPGASSRKSNPASSSDETTIALPHSSLPSSHERNPSETMTLYNS